MKKQVAMAATLVASACAVTARAQSSVTLYGVIDEGFNYTNNVGGEQAYELQSGYAQGSRWGLTGAEDLGGGTKAVFTLESGYNLNNGRSGQGGVLIGRQAFAGVSDARFGALKLGRQYDSLVDFLAPTTANGNWGGSLFSHPYDNDNTDNSFRVNNAVKYTSPDIGGFKFGGTYGFSNAAGRFANNRVTSVGAQYASGGLVIAAAYLDADNPSGTAGGAVPASDENFRAERLKIYGAGVNYTLGAATLGFVYTNSSMSQPVSTSYISGSIVPAGGALNALRFQNFELNGAYRVTPAFFLGAQYVYTIANAEATAGNARPAYHTLGVMADYNLSVRTDLYAQAAYQRVAGDTTGTALDRAYVPGAADASSNASQVVLRVALRHRF